MREKLSHKAIAFIILTFVWASSVSGCSDEDEDDSYGTMECPAWWSTYSNGENVQWIIRVYRVVRITFSRFDTEECCDKVSIYERSTSANSYLKRFRLSGSGEDVRSSTYYLRGPVFVHFTSDGSVTKGGIKLHYSTEYYSSLSSATEATSQTSGTRTSHPDFGSTNYPNNFNLDRSIYCPSGYYVSINFTEFDTEEHKDYLKIYSGYYPNVGSSPLAVFSGSLKSLPTLRYPHSVTLKFSTDRVVQRHGFRFQFSVQYIYRPSIYLFHASWNGLASGGYFTLQLQPAYTNATTTCYLQNACRPYERLSVKPTSSKTLESVKYEYFQLSNAPEVPAKYCISHVSCAVQVTFGDTLRVEKTFSTVESDPPSASIEVLTQDFNHETQVLKFHVQSQPACPNIRHRCELITSSESSIYVQKVNSSVSPVHGTCSTKTLFQFRIQPVQDSSSVIACKLKDGKTALKPLILPHQKITWNLSNWTGSTSSGSFSVSLDPGVGVTSAHCTLTSDSDCEGVGVESSDASEQVVINSEILENTAWFYSNLSMLSEDCISRITCRFNAPNGWERIASVEPDTVFPNSVRLDLFKEDSWLSEGTYYVITATSDKVCPSVRHQCELRSTTASSQPFESISLESVSQNYSCNATQLQTTFALPENLSIFDEYEIACQLAGGKVEIQQLTKAVFKANSTMRNFSYFDRASLINAAAFLLSTLLATTAVLIVLKRCQTNSKAELENRQPTAKEAIESDAAARNSVLQVPNPVYAENSGIYVE